MVQSLKKQKPLVSVITITLNRAAFIEKAIQSVMSQDYDNIEHIIVDGMSRDNTLEILKKYEGKYNMHWVSGKDKNQTDAWNKGLKLTKGDIIGYCHSDDYYVSGAISKIVRAFEKNSEVDLVFGACQEFNYQAGRFETIFRTTSKAVSEIKPDNLLNQNQMFFQPSLFYSRRIVEKTGPLNIDIKFVMDYEWWYRMIKNGAKAFYIDEILAIIGHHPQRGSVKAAAKGVKASMDLIKMYGGKVPLSLKASYYRWRYPQIPNFFKKHAPFLLSAAKKIINRF